MYYRVAIQGDSSALWTWKSTVLSELSAVFQFLRLYRALPQDHLRVFSFSSHEEMNEQLVQENKAQGSTSATAAQFLHERLIGSSEVVYGEAACGTRGNEQTTSIAIVGEPPLNERGAGAYSVKESSRSLLERRRVELERGAGGDHDLPYQFTLPTSIPQVLAWMRLLTKVQHCALQP